MVAAIEQFFLAVPALAYVLVFAAAFAESVAFLGIFVPGTFIVVLAGVAAEQWPHLFHFWYLLIFIVLGVFMGNVTTYLLGRYFGPPLFSERNFYLKRRYLERAQEYSEVHGGKSLFTGQFLGPLRSLVPFVAGMTEMPYYKFFSWTLAATLTWSLTYLSLGYFFGASWEAVQLWGTRLSIFVLLLIAFFVANWVIGRFLIRHERQVRAVLVSIGRSVANGFLSNEYISALLRRYPRFFRFLRNRFSPTHVLGLPFTVAGVASVAILFYLLLLIHAIIIQGPLVGIDERVFAAVMFIRDPLLNPIMQFVTNLAGWPVIGFVVALAYFLWFHGERFRTIVLIIGVPLAVILQALMKVVFNRARPDADVALVQTLTDSFPSGHAVLGIVFYGFAVFVLLRYVQRWRTKVFVTLIGASLITLIGFSRVYLGVHWPSDVLGGFLFGGWWLVFMMLVAYIGERSWLPSVKRRVPLVTIAVITSSLIGAALAGVVAYAAIDPLRTVHRGSIDFLPVVYAERFAPGLLARIPRQTETFSGRLQAPINLVFVGKRDDIVTAFRRAEWHLADPANVATIVRTVTTSLNDQPYPTAPFSPVFYDGRVQDIGIQKSTPQDSVRQRHHIRLWLAPIALASGEEVWVGSATFDEGVGYSPVLRFPTHIISPDIDTERDYIFHELLGTGSVAAQQTMPLGEPVLGTTGAGSPFFTDGRAHVMWIDGQP